MAGEIPTFFLAKPSFPQSWSLKAPTLAAPQTLRDRAVLKYAGDGGSQGPLWVENHQKTHRMAISGVTKCWFPSNLDQKRYVKIYGQWQYILRIWWCITQLRSTHCTKSMHTMLHLSPNFQPEKCDRSPHLVPESFRIPWFPAFILMILKKPIPRSLFCTYGL